MFRSSYRLFQQPRFNNISRHFTRSSVIMAGVGIQSIPSHLVSIKKGADKGIMKSVSGISTFQTKVVEENKAKYTTDQDDDIDDADTGPNPDVTDMGPPCDSFLCSLNDTLENLPIYICLLLTYK